MNNLRCLSLADNPLRPPLSDFLGYHSHGTGGITEAALAELVVQFLNDFVAAHTPEESRSPEGSTSSVGRRTPSVHYRGRAMRMKSGGDTSAASITTSENDDFVLLDETNNNVVLHRHRQMAPTGRGEARKGVPTWLRILLIIGILIVGIPMFLAYFVDSSYFDMKVEDWPIMGYFWEEYYKSVHETAAQITYWIPKSDNFVLRGPPDAAVDNMRFWSSWFK